MKYITIYILFIQTYAFINKSVLNNINRNILKASINIQPFKTIAFYKLNTDQKKLISKSINKRFIIEPIHIDNNLTEYLGLTLFKYNTSDSNRLSYKCQLFVYVKDIETNLLGQYILESVEYKDGLYIDNECVLCSFYCNNSNYFSFISYHQHKYDIYYYNNYNYFDFIYENKTYYKNINNDSISNIIRYPHSRYISQLNYKNMIWNEANLIIYYKNSFNYVIE